MRAFRAAAMHINIRTCVCRLAVLALIVVFGGSRAASAAPLLVGATGTACDGVVGDTSLLNCRLFALEATPTQTLAGSFTQDNDVALFQFMLTGAASVSAFTSGDATALDSLLGLFTSTGNIVRYFSPVEGDFVDAENDAGRVP